MPAIKRTHPEEATMADGEQKRESGAGLMFVGLAIWVVDLLVIFFLPSAIRMGRSTGFVLIVVVLFLLGLILMIAGYMKRRRAGAEE
jgi:NADH:ubiquinone oxidoreductase subunit 3 (subunit A)